MTLACLSAAWRLATSLALAAGLLFRRSVSHASLRASEEQYRLLFENSPQPMWFCDQKTHRFLEVNAAAVDAYGFSRNELLRMELAALRPLDQAPSTRHGGGSLIGLVGPE